MLQKVQLTSLHFHPGHTKKSDYDFDLFIIGQFLDGLQPECSMSVGQFKLARPSRLA
jgi:hypothetical protein